jgi:hypothetical protein
MTAKTIAELLAEAPLERAKTLRRCERVVAYGVAANDNACTCDDDEAECPVHACGPW